MAEVSVGPVAGRGGACDRSDDGWVGLVVVAIYRLVGQSVVISVMAARVAFSSMMALAAA